VEMIKKLQTMEGVTLKLFVQYSENSKVIRTKNKATKIVFKNGDLLTFTNGKASKIFKNLCRNKPGENLE
jgi:hypothetical protein